MTAPPPIEAAAPPVVMHLVDDEILALDHRGECEAIRMRIWRHRDYPAVILSSQEQGYVHPCLVSCMVANVAYRVYLAHDALGFQFFEWDGKSMYEVTFVGWGHERRMILYRAVYRESSRATLEHLVGTPVELDAC